MDQDVSNWLYFDVNLDVIFKGRKAELKIAFLVRDSGKTIIWKCLYV